MCAQRIQMEYEKQRKLKAIVRSFVPFRIFTSLLRLIYGCVCVSISFPLSFRSVHLLCKQSERKQIRIFVLITVYSSEI